MSKVITVMDNQSIMDIAIQHCGDVDRMLDIVENNTIITKNDTSGVEIDLSWPLVPGQKLTIQDEWVNLKVVNELTDNISTAE